MSRLYRLRQMPRCDAGDEGDRGKITTAKVKSGQSGRSAADDRGYRYDDGGYAAL